MYPLRSTIIFHLALRSPPIVVCESPWIQPQDQRWRIEFRDSGLRHIRSPDDQSQDEGAARKHYWRGRHPHAPVTLNRRIADKKTNIKFPSAIARSAHAKYST